MKVLLVSGVSSRTQFIISNLERLGFEVDLWTFAKTQSAVNQVVPKDCEAVFVLIDFLSHGVAEALSTQAAKRGIHYLRMPHRWAFIYQDLQEKQLIHERPPTRIEMGATPDKAPEALVIGGYLQDRAEIFSRMINYGWKVKEHWLSGETGHDYNKARNGIKLVVVLRDTLENKQYQQAHTLAQLSRVPIIKWDVNRELFRKRLEQQSLLYSPLEVPAPPAPTAQLEFTPLIPGTQKYDDALLNSPEAEKPIEVKGFIERRHTITATAALDSIVDILKPLADELHTNPLFNGVTVQVLDNGTVSILPIARNRIITTEGMKEPVVTVHVPKVGACSMEGCTRVAIKFGLCALHYKQGEFEEPRQFVGPGLVGSHDPTDRSIRDPTLEPRVPKPRPVLQPVPPKIEAPAPKPTAPSKPGKGRGKGYLKGRKLHMECRYPGCKTLSLGPRFGFMCKAHKDIPVAQRKEYQKLFNVTHPL